MEYLNIDYNIKRLIIIAMANYKKEYEQAMALGITRRTLYNYKKKYKLGYEQKKS